MPCDVIIIDIFLKVIFVVGLWVFIGNSGVISFGHTAFACLGGYVAAWTTIKPMMKGMSMPGLPDWLMQMEIPFWAAAVAGGAFAVLFWAFGLPPTFAVIAGGDPCLDRHRLACEHLMSGQKACVRDRHGLSRPGQTGGMGIFDPRRGKGIAVQLPAIEPRIRLPHVTGRSAQRGGGAGLGGAAAKR